MNGNVLWALVLVIVGGLGVSAGAVHGQESVSFPAADGATVHGYWYRADPGTPRALILAFHQGGASGRGEYGPIVPRLNTAGYDVLAVDQRAGGNLFGGENRTVGDGEDAPYCDAAPDLAGTLSYARRVRPDVPIILWGSSYSGALALRLAATNPAGVVGVLGFSPASGGPMVACRGEDLSAQIEVPVLALRPRAEVERESAAAQFETFRDQGHTTYVADPGTHGSSMLVADRVEGSVAGTWGVVMEFLQRLTGESRHPALSQPLTFS